MSRLITVFQAANNSKKEITSAASTWSQLRGELGDFYRTGMKAITMQGRITLEHDDAVLPEGPFTLFLTPTAVKSGVQVPDMASIIGSLRQKFNDAMDEVATEIEDGDHMKDVDGSVTTVGNNDLAEEARRIMKGMQ